MTSGLPTAREKFRLNDRIRVTRSITHRQQATGTVVGFGREPHLVRLVRDGTRTPEAWHMDFVESLVDVPDQPSQAKHSGEGQ